MSKHLDLSSPGWLARLILHEWLQDRRVAKQRQNSGSLNEAATAAYRDAHDAQLARMSVTHHPAGPGRGDNIEAMTAGEHAQRTARFRAGTRFRDDPWAPEDWL